MFYNREILHNQCGCIFSNGIEDENCLKRYYIVSDYEKSEKVKIVICNEYLRLKVAEYKQNNKYIINLDDILLPIFSQYVNIYKGNTWEYYGGKTIDISNYTINLPLCEQPKINIKMHILDAIELIRLGSKTFNDIDKRVLNAINYYLEYHVKNKVARTKFEKISVLAKAISKEWNSEIRDIKINELFISILELKAK